MKKINLIKVFINNSFFLIGAKLLSLLLLVFITNRFESINYLQVSVLSSLIATASLGGFVLHMQTSSINNKNIILSNSLLSNLLFYLILLSVNCNLNLIICSLFQSLSLLFINYNFCYNKKFAILYQSIVIFISQPIIYYVCSFDFNIEFNNNNYIIFSILFFLVIVNYVRRVPNHSVFVVRSIEVIIVSSYSYYILSKGFSQSNENQLFIFWLLTQFGNVFVFLGNSFSVYLIPELAKNKNSINPSKYRKFILFLIILIFFLLITNLIFKNYSSFLYCILLFISGITKVYTSILLSQEKTFVILVANLFGPMVGFIYEYIHPLNSFDDLITLLLLNAKLSLFVYYMYFKDD